MTKEKCDHALEEPKTTQKELSLITAVIDLEKVVAQQGWDQAPTLYALVETRTLLSQMANLSSEEKAQLKSHLELSPHHLTAVLQDNFVPHNLSESLGHIVFGEEVAGVAIALERFVIPPQALAEAPQEPEAQEQYLLNHPQRQDVRLVAGVLRSGETWCATRARNNDHDDMVGQGKNLVPDLLEAMAATLLSDGEIAELL